MDFKDALQQTTKHWHLRLAIACCRRINEHLVGQMQSNKSIVDQTFASNAANPLMIFSRG